MNIIEVKQKQRIKYYKERKILTSQKEKIKTMKKEHNNPELRYSRFRKILRKVNQTYY